jgi:hypothetical protein
MLLNGQLFVESIRASAVYADKIYADNYVYHGVPFAPTILRALPGMVRPAAPAQPPADTPPAGTDK